MSATHPNSLDSVRAINFNGEHLELLDQRQLPAIESYLTFTRAHEVAEAITDMVVRGAPAIGIAAAYGIVLEAQYQASHNMPLTLEAAFECLAKSRPTAVNLFWALDKMKECLNQAPHNKPTDQLANLLETAQKINDDDIKSNHSMGDFGAQLIECGANVYTHCNAGALATGGYGTALGVIRSAFNDGKIKQVYAGETRPWLQGARLTTWELMRDNIPVKLSCEGAAGQLLRDGNIHWVIVGADRIAANGDVANKIGTYNLAVLAKHHNVKFMVAAPSSTFDLNTESGKDIPIESRPMNEVTQLQGQTIAPEHCEAINPSFDTTPYELINAIVCEKGIILPPFKENILAMLGAKT